MLIINELIFYLKKNNNAENEIKYLSINFNAENILIFFFS